MTRSPETLHRRALALRESAGGEDLLAVRQSPGLLAEVSFDRGAYAGT